MFYYFAFVSSACLLKKPSPFQCYGSSITRIFSYIYCFSFYFTLVKFDIYDVTNSYITNRHTNLAYIGLAKTIVAQDGTGSLFFKDAG